MCEGVRCVWCGMSGWMGRSRLGGVFALFFAIFLGGFFFSRTIRIGAFLELEFFSEWQEGEKGNLL